MEVIVASTQVLNWATLKIHILDKPSRNTSDLSIDPRQPLSSTSISPADDAGEKMLVAVVRLHREWTSAVALARVFPCRSM